MLQKKRNRNIKSRCADSDSQRGVSPHIHSIQLGGENPSWRGFNAVRDWGRLSDCQGGRHMWSTEDAARGLHPDYRSYMQDLCALLFLYCEAIRRIFSPNLTRWQIQQESLQNPPDYPHFVCVWPRTCSPQGPTSLGTSSWVQLPVIEAVKFIFFFYSCVVLPHLVRMLSPVYSVSCVVAGVCFSLMRIFFPKLWTDWTGSLHGNAVPCLAHSCETCCSCLNREAQKHP